MRRALILVLAVLALLAGAAPAQAQSGALAGCRVGPEHEVCFNDPTGGGAQRAVLFRRLRALIKPAGAGDEINVAMFTWTEYGRKVTEALVGARQRGAAVAVVADDTADAAQLDALRAGGVSVTVCALSCTSHEEGSIQHAKLFLLKIGGRKHTVVTSSNLTGHQRDDLANDLVHTFADDELYDYYRTYWTLLSFQNWFFWGEAARVKTTSRGTTAMVFERDEIDPVVRILRSIRKCTPTHRKVWVAVTLYTRTEIRRRLARLWRKYRCDVRIVALDSGKNRRFARKGLPNDRVRKWPIHHKMLLVDAGTNKGVRRVVYTGSHNFTRNALVRHDEIWTGYTSPFVVGVYAGYFDRLYAAAPPWPAIARR